MDIAGTKVRYGMTTSESFVHCLYLIAKPRSDCNTRTTSSIRVTGGMLNRGSMVKDSAVAACLEVVFLEAQDIPNDRFDGARSHLVP